MKIEFINLPNNQFEIRMVGRLDECDIMINALENSVQDSPSVREATSFLRKKHSSFRKNG